MSYKNLQSFKSGPVTPVFFTTNLIYTCPTTWLSLIWSSLLT